MLSSNMAMSNPVFGIASKWCRRMSLWDWRTAGLLCFCVMLRWLLVWNGGQFWFPDERRFWWSGEVVHCLVIGFWKQSLLPIVQLNQHPGFTFLGCVPVAIHWGWKHLAGISYRVMPFYETARFAT